MIPFRREDANRGELRQPSEGGTPLFELPAADAALQWDMRAGNFTLDANGELATCADLSGNGRTGTIVAGLGVGNRPSVALSADFGGANAAAFGGGSNEILRSAVFSLVSSPCTVYLGVKMADPSPSTRNIFDGAQGGQRRIINRINATGWNASAPSNLNFLDNTSAAALLAVVFNTTNSETYVDDMGTATAVGTVGSWGLQNGVSVGGNNTTTGAILDWVCCYIYAAVHNQTQREAVAAFTNQEWGIGAAP